jgi:hypothetical protein
MPFTIPDSLTQEQANYLKGLLEGDPILSLLKRVQLKVSVSDVSDDFGFYQALVSAKGGASGLPNSLSVSRENLLRMLFYADDRDRQCLVLQCCFGLTKSFQQGGEIVLIQRGNMRQLEDQSDLDLYFGETVYRNSLGKSEFFRNFNLNDQLPPEEARRMIGNFQSLYPTTRTEPFIHGFQLPVRPFLKLLLDREGNGLFEKDDHLTFKWGVTSFQDENNFGNFTLCIGPGDVPNESWIVFRTLVIVPTDEPTDCPPKTGCPKKNGS